MSPRKGDSTQLNRPVRTHPDTGCDLHELVVPQWDQLLYLAAKAYEMTSLGCLGADIVIDKDLGPMMLELNARPGLAIQVANEMGLLPRLKTIEALGKKTERMGPEERIAYSKELD
jgi:hypothetical protein